MPAPLTWPTGDSLVEAPALLGKDAALCLFRAAQGALDIHTNTELIHVALNHGLVEIWSDGQETSLIISRGRRDSRRSQFRETRTISARNRVLSMVAP